MLAGVGVTALAVADARARESERGDRLFEDPYARAFADAAREALAPRQDGAGESIDIRAVRDAYIAVRTRFFDDALLEAVSNGGCRQVVVLGAGLDARAYRLGWPKGTT